MEAHPQPQQQPGRQQSWRRPPPLLPRSAAPVAWPLLRALASPHSEGAGGRAAADRAPALRLLELTVAHSNNNNSSSSSRSNGNANDSSNSSNSSTSDRVTANTVSTVSTVRTGVVSLGPGAPTAAVAAAAAAARVTAASLHATAAAAAALVAAAAAAAADVPGTLVSDMGQMTAGLNSITNNSTAGNSIKQACDHTANTGDLDLIPSLSTDNAQRHTSTTATATATACAIGHAVTAVSLLRALTAHVAAALDVNPRVGEVRPPLVTVGALVSPRHVKALLLQVLATATAAAKALIAATTTVRAPALALADTADTAAAAAAAAMTAAAVEADALVAAFTNSSKYPLAVALTQAKHPPVPAVAAAVALAAAEARLTRRLGTRLRNGALNGTEIDDADGGGNTSDGHSGDGIDDAVFAYALEGDAALLAARLRLQAAVVSLQSALQTSADVCENENAVTDVADAAAVNLRYDADASASADAHAAIAVAAAAVCEAARGPLRSLLLQAQSQSPSVAAVVAAAAAAARARAAANGALASVFAANAGLPLLLSATTATNRGDGNGDGDEGGSGGGSEAAGRTVALMTPLSASAVTDSAVSASAAAAAAFVAASSKSGDKCGVSGSEMEKDLSGLYETALSQHSGDLNAPISSLSTTLDALSAHHHWPSHWLPARYDNNKDGTYTESKGLNGLVTSATEPLTLALYESLSDTYTRSQPLSPVSAVALAVAAVYSKSDISMNTQSHAHVNPSARARGHDSAGGLPPLWLLPPSQSGSNAGAVTLALAAATAATTTMTTAPAPVTAAQSLELARLATLALQLQQQQQQMQQQELGTAVFIDSGLTYSECDLTSTLVDSLPTPAARNHARSLVHRALSASAATTAAANSRATASASVADQDARVVAAVRVFSSVLPLTLVAAGAAGGTVTPAFALLLQRALPLVLSTAADADAAAAAHAAADAAAAADSSDLLDAADRSPAPASTGVAAHLFGAPCRAAAAAEALRVTVASALLTVTHINNESASAAAQLVLAPPLAHALLLSHSHSQSQLQLQSQPQQSLRGLGALELALLNDTAAAALFVQQQQQQHEIKQKSRPSAAANASASVSASGRASAAVAIGGGGSALALALALPAAARSLGLPCPSLIQHAQPQPQSYDNGAGAGAHRTDSGTSDSGALALLRVLPAPLLSLYLPQLQPLSPLSAVAVRRVRRHLESLWFAAPAVHRNQGYLDASKGHLDGPAMWAAATRLCADATVRAMRSSPAPSGSNNTGVCSTADGALWSLRALPRGPWLGDVLDSVGDCVRAHWAPSPLLLPPPPPSQRLSQAHLWQSQLAQSASRLTAPVLSPLQASAAVAGLLGAARRLAVLTSRVTATASLRGPLFADDARGHAHGHAHGHGHSEGYDGGADAFVDYVGGGRGSSGAANAGAAVDVLRFNLSQQQQQDHSKAKDLHKARLNKKSHLKSPSQPPSLSQSRPPSAAAAAPPLLQWPPEPAPVPLALLPEALLWAPRPGRLLSPLSRRELHMRHSHPHAHLHSLSHSQVGAAGGGSVTVSVNGELLRVPVSPRSHSGNNAPDNSDDGSGSGAGGGGGGVVTAVSLPMPRLLRGPALAAAEPLRRALRGLAVALAAPHPLAPAICANNVAAVTASAGVAGTVARADSGSDSDAPTPSRAVSSAATGAGAGAVAVAGAAETLVVLGARMQAAALTFAAAALARSRTNSSSNPSLNVGASEAVSEAEARLGGLLGSLALLQLQQRPLAQTGESDDDSDALFDWDQHDAHRARGQDRESDSSTRAEQQQ